MLFHLAQVADPAGPVIDGCAYIACEALLTDGVHRPTPIPVATGVSRVSLNERGVCVRPAPHHLAVGCGRPSKAGISWQGPSAVAEAAARRLVATSPATAGCGHVTERVVGSRAPQSVGIDGV